MLPLSSPAAEEDLSAPPPVTAWSWAIADADTGEILWHHLGDEPRKTASTTKMMCAHLVLQMAARDPKVLDERVTFSPLADKTVGSTADIQAGETVTVLDALYGLMLPSGNDAGNALAEHFNARCEPPDETMLAFGLANPVLQSRVRFIAEMNRTRLARPPESRLPHPGRRAHPHGASPTGQRRNSLPDLGKQQHPTDTGPRLRRYQNRLHQPGRRMPRRQRHPPRRPSSRRRSRLHLGRVPLHRRTPSFPLGLGSPR